MFVCFLMFSQNLKPSIVHECCEWNRVQSIITFCDLQQNMKEKESEKEIGTETVLLLLTCKLKPDKIMQFR